MSGATGIALVLDTLARGGAERVLVQLANGLDRERFRVHFIATRTPGELAAELAADVAVHSLERRGRWHPGAIGRFAELTARHRIRLIHTHSHSAAYFVRLAKALSGQSWLHVCHDHHGPVEDSTPLRLLDRLLLRRIDYHFAVSEPLRHYALRTLGLDPVRVEVLPNGVPEPRCGPPMPGARFTIIQVARVEPDKNHELALAAAAALREAVPDFQWLMIGRADSPHGARCQRLARELGLQDNVTFVGERPDVAPLLATAHVGVLTSRFEGLPLSLLEYMAAALPVATTAAGECGDLVRASGGGTVVGPGDAAALARALTALARSPESAIAAGAANRGFVRRHFGVAAMLRRVELVYSALLSGGPVPAPAPAARDTARQPAASGAA